jgi:hypothetical protein
MPPDLVQQPAITDAQQSSGPLAVPSCFVQSAADRIHLRFIAEDAQRPLRHPGHLVSSYFYATALLDFHFHWIHFASPSQEPKPPQQRSVSSLIRTWFSLSGLVVFEFEAGFTPLAWLPALAGRRPQFNAMSC